MQISITNGYEDSFILKCWTDIPQKQNPDTRNQPYFVEKILYLIIEDNHLFIVDNNWNSLAVKKLDNSINPKKRGKARAVARRSKPKLMDGVCIDLISNNRCKSMEEVRKKTVK